MKGGQEGVKLPRKEVEKNRRIHMKKLCFKLTSLIPPYYLKEAFSQQEQLDQAAVYIRGLKQQVDRLNEKRKLACMTMSMGEINRGAVSSGLMLGGHSSSPVVEVTEMGSNLKVVLLIGGPTRKFFFCDVIGVLEEEGVEVINANFSLVGDKALHIIHSQVLYTRLGFDAERVCQRLNELVNTAG